MDHVEKTIQVDVPLRTAYDQWTQFESFPHFMEGVKEVRPENLGSDLGIVGNRISGDLGRFKKFIEQRQKSTGQWRGKVDSF